MSENIVVALIGVGATIAGTILGWLLNTWSNKGKLNIYVSKWIEKLECSNKDNEGGFLLFDAISKDDVTHYNYSGSFDIYNSSNNTKIMRDFKVIYLNGKKCVMTSIPLDDSTRRINGSFLPASYKNIDVINIPSKTVVNIKVHYNVGREKEDVEFLWNSKSVYIQYTDEKNKRRMIKISDCDYESILYKNYMEATK